MLFPDRDTSSVRPPHASAQDSPRERRATILAGRAALAALVCLTLIGAGSDRIRPVVAHLEETPATSGAGATCGEEATSWSAAAANGVRARLVRLVSDQPPTAAPPDHHRVAARLTIENGTTDYLPLGPAAFALVACDGTIYPAVADADRRPPPADLPAGRSALGWVTFVVPETTQPALLVVRIDVGEACRASLGFPLILRHDSDAADETTPTTAATEPLARFLAPCEGGSATGGATTGGEPSAIGADGSDGVEDDAVGGDGCPGQDATGSGAIGGDGGDGGDATGDAGAIGGAAPDCQMESGA